MLASPGTAEPLASAALDDLELQNRIRWYLARTGYRPLRLLTVEARDGVVLLRGTVPSYYLRQLAIACQQNVKGVRCLVDEVHTSFERPDPRPHPR